MANSPQAKKRARQGEDRRQHNMAQRSEMRTAVKKVLSAIEAGEKDAAVDAYKAATSKLDIMADKNIIHANKAARHKSRLNAHIKAMS